jgi:hypothetical protein
MQIPFLALAGLPRDCAAARAKQKARAQSAADERTRGASICIKGRALFAYYTIKELQKSGNFIKNP